MVALLVAVAMVGVAGASVSAQSTQPTSFTCTSTDSAGRPVQTTYTPDGDAWKVSFAVVTADGPVTADTGRIDLVVVDSSGNVSTYLDQSTLRLAPGSYSIDVSRWAGTLLIRSVEKISLSVKLPQNPASVTDFSCS